MNNRTITSKRATLSATVAIVIAAIGSVACDVSMFYPPLDVVERVEVNRFLGRWYEIARYPNSFEEGCTGITAEYGVRDDTSITVKNTCIEGSLDGPVRTIEGYAEIADADTNAKLNVVFFPPFGAPYWILELDEDYQWAVIGEPSRSFFWILSRTPTMDSEIYNGIVSRMADKGYDSSRLILIEQVTD